MDRDEFEILPDQVLMEWMPRAARYMDTKNLMNLIAALINELVSRIASPAGISSPRGGGLEKP